MALNVLTSEAEDPGKRFGCQNGRWVDQLVCLKYITAAASSPILPRADAFFDLQLGSIFPAGDCTHFPVAVLEAKIPHSELQLMVFPKKISLRKNDKKSLLFQVC